MISAMEIEIDDLADAADVAELIGLSNPNGVSVYRRRYADFPEPVVEKGRCLLWIRSDVVAWSAGRPRRRRSD